VTAGPAAAATAPRTALLAALVRIIVVAPDPEYVETLAGFVRDSCADVAAGPSPPLPPALPVGLGSKFARRFLPRSCMLACR